MLIGPESSSTSEEARRAARVIPEQEALSMTIFMREALKDAQMGRQQADGRAAVGAVIVDPSVGKVVAAAAQERQRVHDESPPWMRDHPLHHAVMLCVQQVGRAIVTGKQRSDGERTRARKPPDKGESPGERGSRKEEGTTRGSGGGGGASVSSVPGADPDAGVDLISPEQYFCTGLDLYITREPCLM